LRESTKDNQMKRFLRLVSAGILVGLGLNGYAQNDIHYSQFYENALLRNPALTGIFTGDYKIGFDYRSQWAQVSKPYTTVMLSAETRILVNREISDYLSFGLAFDHDKAGSVNFSTTRVYPAIAYNKALEDKYYSYLSVGLTCGYMSTSLDQSRMTTPNQFIGGEFSAANSTGENAIYRRQSDYDIGAGVSLNSSLDQNGAFNYYLGVSAYHINTPSQDLAGTEPQNLRMKWQFNAGFHSTLSEQFGVTLHSNVSYQEPNTEYMLGGFFTWRAVPVGLPSIFALNFGAFMRMTNGQNDAFIPMIRVDYRDVSIGFTHDVTNSALGAAVPGASATELTVYVRGMFKHLKNPRDPMYCPRFEDVNQYQFR
jgi:type IX secretion system PorP/SprF family membrane protein